MKIKFKRTNIYVTQKQHEDVKRESEERGITFSEMFRKIIDWYSENKNEK